MIIDSFSAHLRDLENIHRIDKIYEMINVLQETASKYDCAVVLTNDITPQVHSNVLSSCAIKPALGEAYHHRIPQRIFFAKGEEEKIIVHVQKNLFGGQALIKIRITKDGLEDAQ